MRFPTIAQGATPSADGAVTRFVSPEVQNKSWFNPTKPVIFVNGMMNTGADHRASAEALSLMLGCPVIGVYNRKDGFWADLFQCITDKARLTQVQTSNLNHNTNWIAFFDQVWQKSREKRPMLSKEDFAHEMLAGNPAAQSLFALLIGQPGGMLGTPVYCHSQGNLVTSNALSAVTLVKGADSVRGLEVNSFGSPARGWPVGLNRVNNAYTFDPVSFLDLRMDWTSSKVGFKVAHGFLNYVAQDGEFVVNRFRTGGWGMTVNMDEKGLAKFCAGLGTNTKRLRAIFDRLEAAHFTDSDDVALEYVNLLSEQQLAALRAVDPAFIAQLVRLLQAGWTAADEQRAIDRLQAAQGVS
ncbi:hypothetical protein [Paracoccus sp. TOH]|uniref:hypothetical protein n=1 Tax=Paracoccus sp. TOH TaxID=1263728 RepID=UPI0025B19F93|nr:hypothetical protein [Paracoccus sp. TOH]WJS84138.1 hypothetical protein NBE95_10250 [Paracoccus sp. TOH]